MLKILYSDMRNLLSGRAFRYTALAVAFYNLLAAIVFKIIFRYMGGELYADELLGIFASLAPFVVTALTLFVFIGNFNDGIIRNKFLSGASRRDIICSALIAGGMGGILITVVSQISAFLWALFFTPGFYGLAADDVADYCLVMILASCALGVFTTMILMILGGTKIAYVAGLAVTFAFKLMTAEVADKLYPESGVSLLTGIKLAAYEFYDRYVVFSYFSEMLRHDFMDYVLGAAGLVVISFIIGSVVFEIKEIK
ncbi:MAG: hypothetical protein IKN97_08825 [Lachnospiraceae bacterium]|nr:hypothetical protein [Lachnospiraceae bacterium]